MTRPRHSYKRQARLKSQIRHDKAALLALRLEETRLQAITSARKEAEQIRRIEAKAEYATIIAAYAKYDAEDYDERWDYQNPSLIEHRRGLGLPPIGWNEAYKMPIHYPDWMDYEWVYGLLTYDERQAISKKAREKARKPTAAA